MRLTPTQITSTCRSRAATSAAADGSLDVLLGAMCRHLATLPDVRTAKVDEVRRRLLAAGPPSAADLADMLLDGPCPAALR